MKAKANQAMRDMWWLRALMFGMVCVYAGTGVAVELVDHIKWRRFVHLYDLASPAAPGTPETVTGSTETGDDGEPS